MEVLGPRVVFFSHFLSKQGGFSTRDSFFHIFKVAILHFQVQGCNHGLTFKSVHGVS